MFSPKSDSAIVVFAHRGLRAGRCPTDRGGISPSCVMDVYEEMGDGFQVTTRFCGVNSLFT